MSLKLKYITIGAKVISAIVRNKISGYRAPLLAYILVTNRCHLNCVYCFSNAHKTENRDIPLEKLYGIIDQLEECGTILVTLTGGEPCLREDISEIIEYASRKKMMVELATTGLNFEKHLDAIKKLDFLCISVDGGEEEHDRNRGKGSFKVAMRALELACDNGIHTRIHACFSRNNTRALPDLMEISKKYKVRANIAIPSVHTDDPAIAFEDDEIREYYRQMKEFKERGYLISNATSTLDFIINWPGDFGYIAEKPDPNLPYIPCKRKDFSIYVDVDGYAYPCCAVWGKRKASVYKKGVREVFDSFQGTPCTTCIREAEFHLLFQGSLASLMNVASLGLLDRMKKIVR